MPRHTRLSSCAGGGGGAGEGRAGQRTRRKACVRHIQARYNVLRVEVGQRTPDEIAAQVRERLRAFYGSDDDMSGRRAHP